MYIYMEGSEQLSAVPDELFRRIITDCRFVGGWVSRKAGKPSPDVVAKRDVSPPLLHHWKTYPGLSEQSQCLKPVS